MIFNEFQHIENCGTCKYFSGTRCGCHSSHFMGDMVKIKNWCTQHEKQKSILEEIKEKAEKEAVNHPSHYNKGIEVIDIIESWGLNFSLGNAIKYILRAPHKSNQIEDLKKASWYIKREIEFLEKSCKEDEAIVS